MMPLLFSSGPSFSAERRLLHFAGSIEGGAQFNMTQVPDGAPDYLKPLDKNTVVEMTEDTFRLRLEEILEEQYQRAVQSGLRMSRNVSDYAPDLAGQMTDFNDSMNRVVRHVFSVPETQTRVEKFTHVMEMAYGVFWDIVQVDPNFPSNHPLFKSEQWKNGMRVPGVYLEGKMAYMSSAVLGQRFARQRSGEGDRLRRRPPEQQLIQNNVPLRYRKVGAERVQAAWKDKPNFRPDGLAWQLVQEGDDVGGFDHKVEVNMPGRLTMGEYLPGDEPRTGLLVIHGDPDEPENANQLFIDYTDVDSFLQICLDGSDPYFATLLREPGGYLSDSVREEFEEVLMDMPDVEMRDWRFYSQEVIVNLMSRTEEMSKIIEVLIKAGVDEADLPALKDMTLNPAKLANIGTEATNNNIPEDVLKRALASFCSTYRKAQGDAWWGGAKTLIGLP